MKKNYKFFLGGADAEMVRIKEILTLEGIPFEDKNLGWGAKASSYGPEAFAQTTKDGFTPILVELEVDCPLPKGALDINHHEDRSGEPASLLQVLKLLEREPTRWDIVVAANDSGWFPGLQAIGATKEEMVRVRVSDRAAQGITPEQEQEALRALAAPLEMAANNRVIRMAHSKTGPIGDALAIEAITAGQQIPAYLVLSGDGEVNFSGSGNIAQALHEKFPGGWAGGSGLGDPKGNAYWGGYPPHEEVLDFLRHY